VSDKSNIPPWGARRRFLAAMAALGARPLAARAQRITADTVPPPTSPDQDTASLKARTDAADLLTVAVMVNGRGPFNFVVDTGAERSVISADVAATLNLAHGETVTLQGIAKAMVVETIHVETLAFGPFVRAGLTLPILPRSTLAADGYLGLDVINGTRVTFDFKNHQLHIEQPRRGFRPAHADEFNGGGADGVLAPRLLETWIDAKGKAGRLRITDCFVDNVAAVAFIDTGAELSVGNPALLTALRAAGKGKPDLGGIILTGVTGGELAGEVVAVQHISLQNLAFTDSLLAIADAPDFTSWGLHSRPALLIGMNYLRQFAQVAVDYRAQEIHFELSAAPPMPRPGVAITKLG